MQSTRNQIPGTIKSILSDKVVSEIIVSTAVGDITAIITTGSVQSMDLKEGNEVYVMIKATEVGIQKPSA